MIWKHSEHLAQPGTTQCFPYCAVYETSIILCIKLGQHVLPGILVSHLSASVLGWQILRLLCLTACAFWRFRIRSSHLCSQQFHPLCDLPSPQQLFGHKLITYALTSFLLEPFSSISINIEGAGSTRWLACSNYFLFCSGHLNESCLKQSLF